MTKHNERYPENHQAAMMAAYDEVISKIRGAQTAEEIDELGSMALETAEATPTGPHWLMLRPIQQLTTTAALRLSMAKVEEEVSDG